MLRFNQAWLYNSSLTFDKGSGLCKSGIQKVSLKGVRLVLTSKLNAAIYKLIT